MELNTDTRNAIEKMQKKEELEATIYDFMSKKEKNEDNKKTLKQIAEEEKEHANIWKSYSKENIKAGILSILFLKFLSITLGYTFVIKKLAKSEQKIQEAYKEINWNFPEMEKIIDDEYRHEKTLHDMLDEEKLHYVGDMVLGINDALVELTGAIAGVTFALCNTRLVAITGIVTGISATLSMAASNYLAQRANRDRDAVKSSLYTGITYLITVIFLVLPYLILPDNMYIFAFVIMLLIAVLIIMCFNYYISVVKGEKFIRNFLEMVVISLSVAAISFAVGILLKKVLGISTL